METQAKQPLKIGEKYLSISVLGQIKLAAFRNNNKKSESDPDFLGNGVAVWVNSKKSTPEESVL